MPDFTAIPLGEQLHQLEIFARRVLRHYDLADAQLSLLQYEDNAVFRVSCGREQNFVLRISDSEGAGVGEQTSELAWLTALRNETSLIVPEPVFVSRTGASTLSATLWGESVLRCCVLFRWIPGVPPQPGLAAPVMNRLGDFTAKLHSHASAFAQSTDFVRPSWDWERVFGPGSCLHDEEALTRITKRQRELLFLLSAELMRSLSAMKCTAESWGLIHADLHRDNILLEAEQVAVIDFDDCGFGFYLYDVASVLDSVYRRIANTPEDYSVLRGEYLDAYDSVRSLPRDVDLQLARSKIMRDMVNVNFIVKSQNENVRSWGASRVNSALERIEAFLNGRPLPGT